MRPGPVCVRLGCGWLFALGFCLSAAAARADDAGDRAYAQKLYQRLTGTPVLDGDPLLDQMLTALKANDAAAAAHVATGNAEFYDVTVRDLATPLSVKDLSPLAVFNDFQATFIGVAKDDLDARSLLTGTFHYEGFDDLGLPPVDAGNNDHYSEFEAKGYSVSRNLTRIEGQWPEVPEQAGLLTSRAWGAAHYIAGTNRRAVQFAFQEFLCTPIDQWKDRGLLDYHIHRDVDRHPGGDPADFQNRCRSCHAPMDGMAGAFARMDFVGNRLVHTGAERVAAKYNQHAYVYPDGYVTLDDSWINYATQHQNVAFGWRGPLAGKGIGAFGQMLAASRGFSRCMTTRVFQEVCRRPPAASEQALVETLTDGFEAGGYKLRALFEATAIQDACIGRDD